MKTGCIIGLGPAGLGAALQLSRSGPRAERLLCLEAGVAAHERYCSIIEGRGCRRVVPCQVTSGVGGASVLAGGKISGFPAGRGLGKVVGELHVPAVLSGALTLLSEYLPLIAPVASKASIAEAVDQYARQGFEFRYYDAHLYREADLVSAYTRMVREIEGAGGEVHLQTLVTEVQQIGSRFRVLARHHDRQLEWMVDWILVAVGRSGEDLILGLIESVGLPVEQGRTDLGVRLEFPTTHWPDIDRVHNDLKLQFGDARTFCVCKDGVLAPYRLEGFFLTEGHATPSSASGFTNLAITIRNELSPADLKEPSVLEGIRTRAILESDGLPIRQPLLDFLGNQAHAARRSRGGTTIAYWRWGNANNCFPSQAAARLREAVGHFVSQFLTQEAQKATSIFAPELDYYWAHPKTGAGYQTAVPNLFVVGDVSGEFRGILQAFASGVSWAKLRVASAGTEEPADAS